MSAKRIFMIKVFAGDLDGDFALAVKRLVAVGVNVFFFSKLAC